MTTVLIKISGGIIDQVDFYNDISTAVQTLSQYVETMNPEKDDAAVYGSHGMLANAKDFLDEDDQFIDNRESVIKRTDTDDTPIYIIGNPNHPLGFMVASPDDPLGFSDPVSAISELGQMRQTFGAHLKLYQVLPLNAAIVTKTELEKFNTDCGVEDFDYSMITEFLR